MLQKLVHILCACLLLIGTTGLVVNKHYCQNELKNAALFLKAKACHSEQQAAGCPMHGAMPGHANDNERKGCCSDKTEYLKADEDQISYSFEWELKKPIRPLFFDFGLPVSGIFRLHLSKPHYLNYKPPLIVYDLPLRLQTFLL